MSNDRELKPCPFCGGKAKLKGGPNAQERYSVWCENLHSLQCGMDKDKAIEEWNARQDDVGLTQPLYKYPDKDDCFRNSLAFCLDVHPSKVPNFITDDPWPAMIEANRKWLQTQGMDLVICVYPGSWSLEDMLDWHEFYNPGRRFIVAGWDGTDSHAVGAHLGKIASNTGPSDTLISMRWGDHKEGDQTHWFLYHVTHAARPPTIGGET